MDGIPIGISSSRGPFSGAMLVLGGVSFKTKYVDHGVFIVAEETELEQ